VTAPVIKVELAFGSTWQTEPASRTWTDVTQYVLQKRDRIQATRGASSARGRVDAGRCDLAFKNADRLFDPTYTAGTYYGDLLPGVPIRITATPAGGASKAVWLGTVAKWPQRYDLGNTFSWVPVEAYDGFDKLSRAKIPRSVLEAEILADSPVAYWPLDETSGSSMVDRSGNRLDGEYVAGTTSLSSSAGGTTSTVGLSLPVADEWYGLTTDQAAYVGALPIVVEAVIAKQGDVTPTGLVLRMGQGNPGDDTFFGISGTNLVGGAKFAGSTGKLASGLTFDDGELHHICYRRTASEHGLFFDGVLVTSSDPSFTFFAQIAGTWVGSRPPFGGYEGFFAHVALFDTDIGTTRIADHSAAALAPLDNQTADQRIGWVLDELGWPTNLRDLEVGYTSLGPATFKPGDAALAYLRLVTASEDGLLFLTADGTLRFLDRYWRYLDTLATVSQFTFTDAAASSTGYAEFDLDLDDELLVNVARFTRRDGVEQVATDATSVGIYGEAEKQQANLLQRTDAEVRALAEWTVATRGTPLPRVPKIRVPLHRYSAADQATVLGLDLGHRVTCVRTPQGVGSAISLAFQIDGIRNDVGGGEWWWEAYVSPVPEDTASLFILDTSELDGPDILAY